MTEGAGVRDWDLERARVALSTARGRASRGDKAGAKEKCLEAIESAACDLGIWQSAAELLLGVDPGEAIRVAELGIGRLGADARLREVVRQAEAVLDAVTRAETRSTHLAEKRAEAWERGLKTTGWAVQQGVTGLTGCVLWGLTLCSVVFGVCFWPLWLLAILFAGMAMYVGMSGRRR